MTDAARAALGRLRELAEKATPGRLTVLVMDSFEPYAYIEAADGRTVALDGDGSLAERETAMRVFAGAAMALPVLVAALTELLDLPEGQQRTSGNFYPYPYFASDLRALISRHLEALEVPE